MKIFYSIHLTSPMDTKSSHSNRCCNFDLTDRCKKEKKLGLYNTIDNERKEKKHNLATNCISSIKIKLNVEFVFIGLKVVTLPKRFSYYFSPHDLEQCLNIQILSIM